MRKHSDGELLQWSFVCHRGGAAHPHVTPASPRRNPQEVWLQGGGGGTGGAAPGPVRHVLQVQALEGARGGGTITVDVLCKPLLGARAATPPTCPTRPTRPARPTRLPEDPPHASAHLPALPACSAMGCCGVSGSVSESCPGGVYQGAV